MLKKLALAFAAAAFLFSVGAPIASACPGEDKVVEDKDNKDNKNDKQLVKNQKSKDKAKAKAKDKAKAKKQPAPAPEGPKVSKK